MSSLTRLGGIGLFLAVLTAASLGGCAEMKEAWDDMMRTPPPAAQKIPSPIHLLLPRSIKIHHFTRTRFSSKKGKDGFRGIDVHIAAIDAFDDHTKAFGKFRFEMYSYKPDVPGNRGKQLAVWNENIIKPRKNVLHWDQSARTYRFKLKWKKSLAKRNFILVAVFQSPFTRRLFDEREFVSGE